MRSSPYYHKSDGPRKRQKPLWVFRLSLYWLLKAIIATTALFWTTPAVCDDIERISAKYRIKAAYILNFTKFIEWPAFDEKQQSTVFRVGILGSDPFGPEADKMKRKLIGNRSLVVERYAVWRESVKECDILFISQSESSRLTNIIAQLEGLPVLTIGDTKGYAEKGIILNFYEKLDQIKFEVNLKAAKKSKFKISSKLLNLAKIIEK